MSQKPFEVEVTDPRLSRIDWLAKLLDSSIPIGSSGYKVGIDPLLGLIPGVGDFIGALLSGYIILEAARLGASRLLLVRMVGNLVIDSLVGAVPVFGDLFDFAYKSNVRNVKLLQEANLRRSDSPAGTKVFSSVLIVFSALFLVMVALVVGIATIFWAIF